MSGLEILLKGGEWAIIAFLVIQFLAYIRGRDARDQKQNETRAAADAEAMRGMRETLDKVQQALGRGDEVIHSATELLIRYGARIGPHPHTSDGIGQGVAP